MPPSGSSSTLPVPPSTELPRRYFGEAVASALECLFKDGALRERLGKNGRLTVGKNFDSTTNAKWLAELFREGTLGRSLESETSDYHTPEEG